MDDSTVALSIDGVEPKEEHVKDNSWKIWSYEHMYTKGEPNKEVKAFLDYMVTDDVQNNCQRLRLFSHHRHASRT